MTRFLAPVLALATLGAQDFDPESHGAPYTFVSVRVTPSGNAAITIGASGVKTGWQDKAPAALGCQWHERDRDQYLLEGICLGWLKPGGSRLHLAPLVTLLGNSGARELSIDVTAPARDAAKPPAPWRAGDEGRWFSYHTKDASPPPALDIDIGAGFDPVRLIVPVLLVLFVPGLIAYIIRLRAIDASAGRKLNWLVWMNWINLAAWLYWITAVRPDDATEFAALLGIVSNLGGFFFSLAVFVVPPLAAIASCLIAVRPLLSSSAQHFTLLLKRQIAAESAVLVPLGIVLVSGGAALTGPGFSMLGLLAAYLVYRGLATIAWRLSFGESTAIESGELFDRATALARKAGVPLARLHLLRTRVPEEANAFATSGDAIILTESLVKGLTPREVDAVIAHELGHHKAGHLRSNLPLILFCAYVLFAGPAIYWAIDRLHLPAWIASIPIAPLLFVLFQGRFSQRREYAADARAVEITGDPEGKIAAFSRLAHLSRIPVQNTGIMGSILSHPSMEARVLALARRSGLADDRALAVLDDPDAAYAERPDRTPSEAAPEAPTVEPVFTLSERVLFGETLNWMQLLVPLAVVTAIVSAFPLDWLETTGALSILVVVTPLAALAAMLAVEILLSRRLATKLHRRISGLVRPPAGALFAGIHPGHGVRCTEGFHDWDFGFLSLEDDWLVYRGEKTSFALPRQSVVQLSVVKGQFAFLREHRVEVEHRGGAFTIGPDFAWSGAKPARRLRDRIEQWIAAGEAPEPVGAPPAGPPALPALPGMSLGRLSALWIVAKATIKLLIAGTLIVTAAIRWTPLAMLIPVLAAAAVLVLELPLVIWPLRPPAPRAPVFAPVEEEQLDPAAQER